MEKNQVVKMMLAGVFFLSGIALMIIFIFTIGSQKGLSEPRFTVHVMYNNVGGLLEGAPVRLAGVNVGNVSSIDFADKSVEGRNVIVTLEIFDKFKKQLNSGANFAINTEGILGEKLVEVDLIDGNAPLDYNKPIIGQDPLSVQGLVDVIETAAVSLTNTAENLSSVDVKQLSEVMGETADALLTTSKSLKEMFKEMQYITSKTKRILNRIEQRTIDGNLFKVF